MRSLNLRDGQSTEATAGASDGSTYGGGSEPSQGKGKSDSKTCYVCGKSGHLLIPIYIYYIPIIPFINTSDPSVSITPGCGIGFPPPPAADASGAASVLADAPTAPFNSETRTKYGDGSKPWYLVNPKIAGKCMFIPLKMVCIGIDP